MGLTEYGLLALVILVPLVISGAVTLWTLEQARLRSRRQRKRPPGTPPPPTDPPGGPTAGSSEP